MTKLYKWYEVVYRDITPLELFYVDYFKRHNGAGAIKKVTVDGISEDGRMYRVKSSSPVAGKTRLKTNWVLKSRTRETIQEAVDDVLPELNGRMAAAQKRVDLIQRKIDACLALK